MMCSDKKITKKSHIPAEDRAIATPNGECGSFSFNSRKGERYEEDKG